MTVKTTTRYAVPLRMARSATHVTLLYLSGNRGPRRPRTPEIEPFGFSGPVVEVQPSLCGPTIHAPVLPLVGVEPLAAFAHVAVYVDLVRRRVSAVALGLPLFVSFPCFGRVVLFSASHSQIIPQWDYWGDESLDNAAINLRGAR